MSSRKVTERALRNRIKELEAELRETKARYAALEIKAKDDAKKLADIMSIIQNGMTSTSPATDANSGSVESPTAASTPMYDVYIGEEIPCNIASSRLDSDSDEIFDPSTVPGARMGDEEDEPKSTAN